MRAISGFVAPLASPIAVSHILVFEWRRSSSKSIAVYSAKSFACAASRSARAATRPRLIAATFRATTS